jgi:hypothetical protein
MDSGEIIAQAQVAILPRTILLGFTHEFRKPNTNSIRGNAKVRARGAAMRAFRLLVFGATQGCRVTSKVPS